MQRRAGQGYAMLAPVSRLGTMASMTAGIQIAIRVDPELLARVDALAEKMSTSWRKASRSDALRACVIAGLPAVEADVAAADDGKRRAAKGHAK